MNKDLFGKNTFQPFDGSMSQFMDMHMKTIKDFGSVQSLDLFNIKKPEELFQKQMNLFVQNSQMMLNFMRHSFDLIENLLQGMTQRTMEETLTNVPESMKKAVKKSTEVVKRATSSVNVKVKKNIKTGNKTLSSKPKVSKAIHSEVEGPLKKGANIKVKKPKSPELSGGKSMTKAANTNLLKLDKNSSLPN